VKAWQRALGNVRVLGPDEPHFRADVEVVWGYIEALERELKTCQDRAHRQARAPSAPGDRRPHASAAS
jgi:hypothetical protein